MTSYYEYDFEGEHFVKDMSGKSLLEVFSTVAIEITMSDCSGVNVTRIVFEGNDWRYAGWQPDMLREIYRADDPDERINIWLPQYDH